jgi:plasmid maintenance system antidote protein VapI
VSPNLAVRLEEAGVSTARAWLAMQTAHDLARERAAGVPKVSRLDTVA